MATAATIKKNIAKLEAALKSKATPKSLKSKLETQLVKSKAELSGLNKGTKPKTSSTKSTQSALKNLKELVNKNKKYKNYKGAGVDLERDADRPAKPIGRRTAKASGKTYYEYRANRIDVKQPPKRYPKLEKGGRVDDFSDKIQEGDIVWDSGNNSYGVVLNTYDFKYGEIRLDSDGNQPEENLHKLGSKGDKGTKEKLKAALLAHKSLITKYPEMGYEKVNYAKGGMFEKPIAAIMDKYGNIKSEKNLQQDLEYLKEAYENKLVTKAEYDKSYDEIKEQLKFLQKKEKGGYMAKGGQVDFDKVKTKYATQDVNLLQKEGQMAITDTKMGVIFGEYKLGKFEFTNRNGDKLFIGNKEEAIDFVKNNYQVEGMAKGGYMADGGFVAVGEKDGYWTIMSKPTTEEKANEVIKMGVPRGEVGKVVTLKEAKEHKKVIGAEYLEKGGYMSKGGYYAKGGMVEHGLEIGDLIDSEMDEFVFVKNKGENFMVNLNMGTRQKLDDRYRFGMGGEMHRTQE